MSEEHDSTLTDMLLLAAGPSHSSLPSLEHPENLKYLSHLTSLPLPTLLAEPTVLKTQSHHLTSSLSALTQASYPTFLSLHHASASLSSSLASFSTSLDALLHDSLPGLDECLAGWSDRTDAVLRDRNSARLVLEQHEKIRDLLDVPLLIDTCVRNGYFAEALALASHASASLSSSSSSTTILQSIRAEVHHSTTHMLLALLSTLHEPNRKLPALWKVVNFLRKMSVFDDENQIAVAFLGGREACLKTALDNCGRDVQALILAASGDVSGAIAGSGAKLGERERDDIAKYLRKYIDLWREGVHDIITQYTTIFLDRSSAVASSDAQIPPNPSLRNLLTTYASHALSTHLLPTLRALLPLVPSAHSSLLTQLTYCATAFARVGMDFRGFLGDIFCDAVQKSVSRELNEACDRWSGQLRAAAATTATTTRVSGKSRMTTSSFPKPSEWLVSSSTLATTHPNPPSPPAHSRSQPPPPHIPPPIMTSYPPLAEFMNALLGTLNSLRLLAPVDITSDLLLALDKVLGDGLSALLGYTINSNSKNVWKRTKAVAVVADGAVDSTVEKREDREEKVLRDVGKVYVEVFVPYMRRALVEGVYGLEMSAAWARTGADHDSQTALGNAIWEWEGWWTSQSS